MKESRFDVTPTEQMHASDALGAALIRDGSFGADLIVFPPNGSVPTHTHPGRHILFCVGGRGTVTRSGCSLVIDSGQSYLVGANEPHAINASVFGLRLLVVGDDVRPISSAERLNVVAE